MTWVTFYVLVLREAENGKLLKLLLWGIIYQKHMLMLIIGG